MFIPFFPTTEITFFLLKLKDNESFVRIGRLLMLSLVSLCTIGYAGEWATGLQSWMPGCTIPKWGCYQGPALRLPEYILKLGAPDSLLLLLPVLALLAAFVLLVKPARMYGLVLVFGWASFLVHLFGSDPQPYTNVLWGSGYWLAEVALLFLNLLSIPLAIVEQMRLHPERDYRAFAR